MLVVGWQKSAVHFRVEIHLDLGDARTNENEKSLLLLLNE